MKRGLLVGALAVVALAGLAYAAQVFTDEYRAIRFRARPISVTLDGQMESTQATGTAPLKVASTTLVTNLNADSCDGFNCTTLLAGAEPYVTVSNSANLSAERALASGGDGITLTDNGANSTLSLGCTQATATQQGCVGTGPNTWAGVKTFNAQPVFGAGFLSNANSTVAAELDIVGNADIQGDINRSTADTTCTGGTVGRVCIEDPQGVDFGSANGLIAFLGSGLATDVSFSGDVAISQTATVSGKLTVNSAAAAVGLSVTTDGVEFLSTGLAPDFDVRGDMANLGTAACGSGPTGAWCINDAATITGAGRTEGTHTFAGAINDGAGTGTTTQVLHGGASVTWGAVVDGDLTSAYSGTGACAAGAAETADNRNAAPTCSASVAFDNEANTFTANQIVGTTATGQTLTVNAASTGSIQNTLILTHTDTNSVGDTTQGVQIQMNLENSLSASKEAGTARAQFRTATSGSEDGQIVFETTSNGTTGVDVLTIDGDTDPQVDLVLNNAGAVGLEIENTHATGDAYIDIKTGTANEDWRMVTGFSTSSCGATGVSIYNNDLAAEKACVDTAGVVRTIPSGGGVQFNAGGSAAIPPTDYVTLYVTEDTDVGATCGCTAGAGTDCVLRARIPSGTEICITCLVSNGGC